MTLKWTIQELWWRAQGNIGDSCPSSATYFSKVKSQQRSHTRRNVIGWTAGSTLRAEQRKMTQKGDTLRGVSEIEEKSVSEGRRVNIGARRIGYAVTRLVRGMHTLTSEVRVCHVRVVRRPFRIPLILLFITSTKLPFSFSPCFDFWVSFLVYLVFGPPHLHF